VAVTFGRGLYQIIYGRTPPGNLKSADRETQRNVGVWVKFWHKHAMGWSPAAGSSFCERLEGRIKKDLPRIRRHPNPGACAYKIAKGELRSFMSHPTRAGP
jgi:hypothetical protein